MKNISLKIFLLCLPILTFGQKTQLDSLIRATEILKEDTIKAQQFIEIGNRYNINLADYVTARKYYEKSLHIADNQHFTKGIFLATNAIANTYGNMGQYLENISFLKKAATIFEENPQLSKNKILSNNYVRIYSNIALAYNYLADYKNAEKFAYKSIDFSQTYNVGSGFGLNTLSDIFLRQKNNEEAKKYALKALEYFQKENTTVEIARTYIRLGLMAKNDKDYPKSIEYYQLAYQNNKKINRIFGMRLSLYNIADAYYWQKDYDKATQYINESIKFADVNDGKTLAETNQLLSSIYRQKGQFLDAIKYGKSAVDYAQKYKAILTIQGAYDNLFETYKAAKDSTNALRIFEKLSAIKDSLYSIEITKNSADLAKKYETEKKEQQIVFLDKENRLNQEKLEKETLLKEALARANDLKDLEIIQKQEIQEGLLRENTLKKNELKAETQLNQSLKFQNNLMLKNSKNEALIRYLLVASLLGFTAFGLNYYRNYKRQKAANEQITKQSEELKTLMREVHHRVKNNLQIIVAMLRMQARSVSDKSAIDALVNSENRLQTIAMVHEKLYKSENLSGVILKDYLQELMEVLARQHQNLVPKFHYEVKDSANIVTNLDTAIPVGLIVNELVTNSFKYAFKEIENCEILLKLDKSQDKYQLQVSDNGIGFPDGKLPKNSGSLGLKLIHLFTEQLDGFLKYEANNGSHFTINFKSIAQ